MSFYQNQDNARRKTGLLVFYFFAAVFLIVAAVNFTLYLTLQLAGEMRLSLLEWLRHPACWLIALITLAVIAGGSLLRIAKLSKGGIAVAHMAGATPLNPATSDIKEKQLINVVEEMAIASGTPVPRVFVMQQENGINAFVAGTESNNTVLAVTKGCLDKLTRDELQGVIGHEFSHILNGDMHLNVKLIGILAGILFIGQIGEFLLRGQSRRNMYGNRSSRDDSKLVPLGLALMLIGYVGLFFGRLIKAAISRQREFLADASSVQFTRNPEGIASALYAIKHYSNHSLLMHAHAEDMNHMCFGETIKLHLSSMLATHPPIEQRIRSIDKTLLPRLKARFRQREDTAPPPSPGVEDSQSAPAHKPSPMATAGFAASGAANINANSVKSSVGQPSPDHYQYASELHKQIPSALMGIAHDHDKADQLLYALLLLESPGITNLPPSVPEQTLSLRQQLQQLPRALRLPILNISVATLQNESKERCKEIVASAIDLIKLDHKITLSEFVYCFLIQQCLADIKRPPRSIKRYHNLVPALATLFSGLVQVSGDTPRQQADNFGKIMQYYSNEDFSGFLKQPPSPKALHAALQQLKRLTPLLKQPIVDASVDCILRDGKAVAGELELLQAICSALECPLPPIIATQ